MLQRFKSTARTLFFWARAFHPVNKVTVGLCAASSAIGLFGGRGPSSMGWSSFGLAVIALGCVALYEVPRWPMARLRAEKPLSPTR